MKGACWCGASSLAAYSPDYDRCEACGTLVRRNMPEGDISRVSDDAVDFYGSTYWFGHQARDLGQPTIAERVRSDLPERCVYWLRALLRHRLPPGRILELGACHGGFVAFLRQAGFDAVGQELSPAIIELARAAFGVTLLRGPVEDHDLPRGSFDVIAMFDVMEHFQDPVASLTRCAGLLKPDGFLLIQTPRVPPDATYEALLARKDPFLHQFREQGHLYLFTEQGARDFFRRCGLPEVAFLPAIFSHYDMFFTASRAPLPLHSDTDISTALSTPSQRVVQALLDLYDQHQRTVSHLAEVEVDREARLRAHEETLRHLAEVEADREARLRAHEETLRHLAEVEADREARLRAHEADREAGLRAREETLRHLAEVEADREARLRAHEETLRHLAEVDADREARLRAHEETLRHLAEVEADREARLHVINALDARVKELEARPWWRFW